MWCSSLAGKVNPLSELLTTPDMIQPLKVSGIVLAGGMSRRLGRNKAIEPFKGEPLISRVIGRLSEITGEIVVVANNCKRAKELPVSAPVRVVLDSFVDGGSLGGIYTGLKHSRNDWAIVVACDMPFVNVRLFQSMFGMCSNVDVVVPELNGHPEPTHALYSTACLPIIEQKLRGGDLKISKFFNDVRVAYVEQEVVQKHDPRLISFINVNTQDDLNNALALATECGDIW